jgi:hypothetical protein
MILIKYEVATALSSGECTNPRKWGELGIKELDKFRRALRLKWLWYNWDVHDQPWKSLLKI